MRKSEIDAEIWPRWLVWVGCVIVFSLLVSIVSLTYAYYLKTSPCWNAETLAPYPWTHPGKAQEEFWKRNTPNTISSAHGYAAELLRAVLYAGITWFLACNMATAPQPIRAVLRSLSRRTIIATLISITAIAIGVGCLAGKRQFSHAPQIHVMSKSWAFARQYPQWWSYPSDGWDQYASTWNHDTPPKSDPIYTRLYETPNHWYTGYAIANLTVFSIPMLLTGLLLSAVLFVNCHIMVGRLRRGSSLQVLDDMVHAFAYMFSWYCMCGVVVILYEAIFAEKTLSDTAKMVVLCLGGFLIIPAVVFTLGFSPLAERANEQVSGVIGDDHLPSGTPFEIILEAIKANPITQSIWALSRIMPTLISLVRSYWGAGK